MSITRAKFNLNKIERTLVSQSLGKDEKGVYRYAMKEANTLVMNVVTDGSEEDKAFFLSTPSGELRLTTVNAEAVAHLELGKKYYIDITPAE